MLFFLCDDRVVIARQASALVVGLSDFLPQSS
jgi:hypothetical protein